MYRTSPKYYIVKKDYMYYRIAVFRYSMISFPSLRFKEATYKLKSDFQNRTPKTHEDRDRTIFPLLKSSIHLRTGKVFRIIHLNSNFNHFSPNKRGKISKYGNRAGVIGKIVFMD